MNETIQKIARRIGEGGDDLGGKLGMSWRNHAVNDELLYKGKESRMNTLLTRSTWRMFCATVLLALAMSTQAASFDCAKASNKVEHIICDNPEISKLDDELNAAYKAAVQDKQQVDAIKQAQKQWLKERNGCADAECVKRAYEERLSLLTIARSKGGDADNAGVSKSMAHYVLMMSEDDSVCKPILAEYNRNISLDLWPQPAPHPYPWPAPPPLTLTWKVKPWKNLAENERVMEKAYTMTEADLDGDGKNETVVRWASWVRSDDRFSSLEIFSRDTVLPDRMQAYEQFFHQNTRAEVIPGGYYFPKLKGQDNSAALNDFDVIQFNGKQYVTGKTVEMGAVGMEDIIVELHDDPQWRVISRVRYGRAARPPEGGLDEILDSICYFKLIFAK